MNEPTLITLKKHRDQRGLFYEVWAGNPDFTPRQVNVSVSAGGVIRGIHAEPWDKYIHVVSGRAFAAIVNMETFEVRTFDLDSSVALFVPAGWGNSFQALEITTYLYLCGDRWEPKEYPRLRYDDVRVNIPWKPLAPILSENDLKP